jgi:RNA polymerase sigma factor (sigma-70 family)
MPTGELEAHWKFFYQTHSTFVRWLVAATGVKGADLEDCVQEVWIDVVRRIVAGQYDPRRGRFGCWLYSVARNRSIDYVRARDRNRAVKCSNMDFLPSHEPDPAWSFEREQRRIALHQALDELSRRTSLTTFQVLYLSGIEGKDSFEVAGELGLTQEQVRRRRRSAIKRLREILNCAGSWLNLSSTVRS